MVPAVDSLASCAAVAGTIDEAVSFSKSRSTDVVMDFLPVRWKLARLERHMVLLGKGRPSSEGFNDRDMMSTDRGLPKGIAECGNIFGLIGVTSMCSVHEVSSAGFSRRCTSTSNVFCSNGWANVWLGMLCSHDSKLKSESWNFLVELSKGPKRSEVLSFPPAPPDRALRWQNSTQDSYRRPGKWKMFWNFRLEASENLSLPLMSRWMSLSFFDSWTPSLSCLS